MLDYDEFLKIIKPNPRPIRSFNAGFSYLEDWLSQESKNCAYGIDLNPDFQRGHVWTIDQQIHYIENVLRRVVDSSGLVLRFNCPTWRESETSGDLPDQVVCIDGLQRLTAIRNFIAGKYNVFGIEFKQLPKRMILRELSVVIQMFDFQNKSELLDYYLDINGGGTPHTQDELERVRVLRQSCRP